MNRRIGSIALVLLATSGTVASAQAINGATSGLTNTSQTITFNAGTPYNPVGATAGYGVTFGNGFFYGPNFMGSGNTAVNFPNGLCPCMSQVDIYLSSPSLGMAFQAITNQGTSVFTAFLNGQQVASFQGTTGFNTSNTPWYGFDQSVELDRVEITPGGGNSAFAVDNVEVGTLAAPEPASLALVATGLIGFVGVAAARRRKA